VSREVRYKRTKVEEQAYCDDGCGRLAAGDDDPYTVAEEHARHDGHVTFVRVTQEHSYWPEE
jgi:hypothetical protein